MTDGRRCGWRATPRELYARLEAETGHSTGFRAIGHLHAGDHARAARERLRREPAVHARGFGVDNEVLSAAEVAVLWPLTRTDDVLAGVLYVADEGRANPVDVATSLAKGARAARRRILAGRAVTGFRTERGRVTAVTTDRGDVECENVVLAAGLWARELGGAGGRRPCRCRPPSTTTCSPSRSPGSRRDLPVIEDPDRYGYYREEGGRPAGRDVRAGAAPGALDGTPRDFAFGSIAARLGPAWRRSSSMAMFRYPGAGRRRHPQVLLRTGVLHPRPHPMLGPSPEVDGLYVAAGLNSPRDPARRRRRQRYGAVAHRRHAAVDVTAVGVDRARTSSRRRGGSAASAPSSGSGVLLQRRAPGRTPSSERGRDVRRSPYCTPGTPPHGARFGRPAGLGVPATSSPTRAPPDGDWDYAAAGDASMPPREEHLEAREAVGDLRHVA